MNDHADSIPFAVDGIEGLARPISEASPTGSDPRFSEEFERVETQVGRIGGVEQLPVDWPTVGALSRQLLETETKDLRLLGHLAVAAGRVHGIEALVSVAEVLATLLDTYKDKVYPSRSKGRVAAMVWLSEQAEAWFAEGGQELGGVQFTRLETALDRCKQTFRALELDDTSFTALWTAAQTHVARALSESERISEIRARFPEGMADVGMAVIKFLDSTAGHTPHTLRLRRWALWMGPPTADKLTVGTNQQPQLEALFQAKDWNALLDASEKLLMEHPFWLDLSVWAARAAANSIGTEGRSAVVGELRGLLTREPDLLTAQTADGAPLASEQSRDWVERELDASGGGADSQAASVRLDGDLRQLMEEGRMRDAMAAASSWITGCSGRVRFARSMALANGFSEFGAANQAFTVFRGLHAHLRSMTVKEWEPALFSACIAGYLTAKRNVQGLGPEDEPLFEELSVLDPAAVMGVMPSG